MRNLITTTLLMFFVATLTAQMPIKNSNRAMDEMLRAQWLEIVKELKLDKEQADEVEPIYFDYVKEMWSADNRNKAVPNCLFRCDTLTNKEAYDAIMRDFDRAQKMLNIKKKYFARFQQVLEVRFIHKMYSVERHVRGRIINEMERRKGRCHFPPTK